MGDVLLRADEHNPAGYFEDLEFKTVNSSLTRYDCTDTEPDFTDADFEVIQAIVQDKKNRGHRHWGWKDPRNSLTFPLYLPYLDDPVVVALFRRPEKCAESMQRRGDLECRKWKAIQLAKEYNLTILKNLMNHFT